MSSFLIRLRLGNIAPYWGGAYGYISFNNQVEIINLNKHKSIKIGHKTQTSEDSNQITPKICYQSTKKTEQSSKAMQDLVEVKQSLSLNEKIEKLKQQIKDTNKPSLKTSENQQNKELKLIQKLRYLEFYDSFDVGSCPEEWHCSQCKEVQVTKKVADETTNDMEGAGHHMKWTFKKVTKWVCEDKEYHDNDWKTEEKCRPEVRMEIRREFNAMITREREMNNGKKNRNKEKELIDSEANQVQTIPKIVQNNVKKVTKTEEEPMKAQNTVNNFHSDDCNTCIRMRNLMGEILPHPFNVA